MISTAQRTEVLDHEYEVRVDSRYVARVYAPNPEDELHPTFRSLRTWLREDWYANGRAWLRPGVHAILVYRFGAWVLLLPPRRAKLYGMLHRVLATVVRNLYNVELPASTRVGHRFVIGHAGDVIIHGSAEIGDDCVVRQNVTIGAANKGRVEQAPRLGDRVEVGAGAVIIGNVRIGSDVRIGANTVVTMHVPDGTTVFVAPPRMFKPRTSREVVRDDAQRSVQPDAAPCPVESAVTD